MINILILSCGTRTKLTRYFKEEGNGIGKVVGTDCSAYAPALYEMDRHYLVPRMTAPDYMDVLLDICRKEKIDAIVPLLEDELSYIASRREIFTKEGVIPIVSSTDTVELCRDKYAFYKHLRKNNLPALPSCCGLEEFKTLYENGTLDFPVFIKPVRGCGSVGIQKVDHMDLLSVLCKYGKEDLLIQQFARGEEYGVDLYVDTLSRKPVSIFLKKKLRMRAGETEKSVSVKDESLFSLIRRTADSLSLSGPVDMDLFRIGDDYYISEINPRFGGGYPHAHSCGMNFPKLIANNISGMENADTTGNYDEGICMLKFTDLITLKV